MNMKNVFFTCKWLIGLFFIQIVLFPTNLFAFSLKISSEILFEEKILKANQPEKIIIGIRSHVSINNLAEHQKWSIFDENNKLISKGIGQTLNNFIFNNAGNYSIKFTEKVDSNIKQAACIHDNIPNQILVFVSPNNMVFDFEKITFSRPIEKGKETKGIVMKVPVSVDSNLHEEIQLNTTIIHTAGIDTNVEGKLISNPKLLKGKQILEYELSGLVNTESYIMFDMVDLNGNVQCYSYPKKVQ